MQPKNKKLIVKLTFVRFFVFVHFVVLRTSALALINPLKMPSLSKPIPP